MNTFRIKYDREDFSFGELQILLDYVEAAEPFIAIDGEPDCDCDEWSVCWDCGQLAERMGEVLKDHGFPYSSTPSEGELSIAARDCAEQLYLDYCAEAGRTPIGITM